MIDPLERDHRRFIFGVTLIAFGIFLLGFSAGAVLVAAAVYHPCDEGLYWNGHQCALKCPPTGCW